MNVRFPLTRTALVSPVGHFFTTILTQGSTRSSIRYEIQLNINSDATAFPGAQICSHGREVDQSDGRSSPGFICQLCGTPRVCDRAKAQLVRCRSRWKSESRPDSHGARASVRPLRSEFRHKRPTLRRTMQCTSTGGTDWDQFAQPNPRQLNTSPEQPAESWSGSLALLAPALW